MPFLILNKYGTKLKYSKLSQKKEKYMWNKNIKYIHVDMVSITPGKLLSNLD